MTKKYNVAVIGATGNTGRETVNILADRLFPINNLYAVASSKSIGKEISFGDKILKIVTIETLDFNNIDIAFFAAGSEVSKKYIPQATACNTIVIDKSSYFRADDSIPLIVPEVNINDLKNYTNQNIISCPNCCTIPLVTTLKPMDNINRIKRVVVSTYQSVSGAGSNGMDELYNQTKAKYTFSNIDHSIFPRQIAFNLIPHIGNFDSHGYTSEEIKIIQEVTKIMGSHIKTSVTSVRVPIFVGHSMSVNVEFEQEIDIDEISEILSESDGIIVSSHNNEQKYITPVEVVGEDSVFVSRIRRDNSQKNTINLWITVDNLRKGAALNSVQIAEELIKHYLEHHK